MTGKAVLPEGRKNRVWRYGAERDRIVPVRGEPPVTPPFDGRMGLDHSSHLWLKRLYAHLFSTKEKGEDRHE